MHSQNWRCTAAMKRMRGKQPAPSGCGQPLANSSRGSTGNGHSAVERSITLESSDGLHLAAEPMCLRGVKELHSEILAMLDEPDDAIRFEKPYLPKTELPIWEFVCKFNRVPKEIRRDGESNNKENKLAQYIRRNKRKLHSETLALLKNIPASSTAAEDNKQNMATVPSLSQPQRSGKLPENSEKPAGLNTESSGVPQPAASCHEPRSPMVFLKYIEPIWADEVAAGQKMFECVANNMKWQNQFKQLSSGDIFIVVMKGRDKVSAVCEVASPAIVKETNRELLKSKLQESRHAALDAYLDGAESFDYVEFKLVFDCRRFLLNGSTAAFLNYVGLSVPKSPSVGLLCPVVHDEHWHNRLLGYMHSLDYLLEPSICHRQ